MTLQRLYFLRQLRKFNLPQELLIQFYSAIIESVLCSSITVWFGSATKTDIRRLQRTVRTAERIIGAPLPSLQELYTSRVRKRAKKVTLDPSHPAHSLFVLLPSGRCYRSLSTKTARHKNSLYSPRPYPTWTTHNTPRYCTSVNNSSNLHLYIGHMHIHSSVYGHFSFCIFLFFTTIVILNYCLFSSLLVFFITLIICCLCFTVVCLYCIVSVLEAPNTKTNSLCVQTHLASKALSDSDFWERNFNVT